MKQLNTHLSVALAKLSADQVKAIKGSKEKAMAAPVAEALRSFCRQDAEFAQAVEQGGSLAECMTAVAKGVGNYISDLDAYKKAVAFFFPGAKIRMQMTIDLIGDADLPAPEKQAAPVLQVYKPEKSELVLNLEDFL